MQNEKNMKNTTREHPVASPDIDCPPQYDANNDNGKAVGVLLLLLSISVRHRNTLFASVQKSARTRSIYAQNKNRNRK